MIFTDRFAGSMRRCTSRQRMPGCTVIVLPTESKASTRLNDRMSIWSAPSVAVCPPMLNRPPPIEIGPAGSRTAATISSVVVGVMTAATRIGLSCVTSFTTGADRGCATDVCTIPHTAIAYATSSVVPSAASSPLPTRRTRRQSVRTALPIVLGSVTFGPDGAVGSPSRSCLAEGEDTDGEKTGGWLRGVVRSGGCIWVDASDDDVDAHDSRRPGADDVGPVRHEQTRRRDARGHGVDAPRRRAALAE